MASSIYVPNFSPIGPVEKNLSLDQEKHGTVVTTIVAPPEVGVTKIDHFLVSKLRNSKFSGYVATYQYYVKPKDFYPSPLGFGVIGPEPKVAKMNIFTPNTAT